MDYTAGPAASWRWRPVSCTPKAAMYLRAHAPEVVVSMPVIEKETV
jgi:hypothetical protein